MDVKQSNHQAVPNRRVLAKQGKRRQKLKSKKENEGWNECQGPRLGKHPEIPSSCSECPKGHCEGQEPKKYYQYGGYYPVQIGETFDKGRYRVLRKLGWGNKSTVWLCQDQEVLTEKYVAVKIMKSNESCRSNAMEEIKLLKSVQGADPKDKRKTKTIQLLNHFTIHGPHGKHVCMVLEIWGPDLHDLIKSNKKGLPIPQVKFIMKQVLEAVEYMHAKCGKKHGNLNPKNIATCLKPSAAKKLAKDAENVVKSGAELPGSFVIHAPKEYPKIVPDAELMNEIASKEPKQKLSAPDKTKVDINDGSSENEVDQVETIDGNPEIDSLDLKIKLRDITWENGRILLTCKQPVHQYRSPEMQLGRDLCESTDFWSLACVAFELATGHFLFDPVQPEEGCCTALAEEHLAVITSLLGEIPRKIRLDAPQSRKFFNIKTGNFKHSKVQDPCNLFDILTRKYEMNDKDAQEFCEFLLPMLEYQPGKRAHAPQCLKHEWILSLANEESKSSEFEAKAQVKTMEENSASTPGKAFDVDSDSMLVLTLNPDPELQDPTVEEKPLETDINFVSTPNVNPSSEHEVQGQTVERKLEQGGDGDTEFIFESTLIQSPEPDLQVKTEEEKPGQGDDADTGFIMASILIPNPALQDPTVKEKPLETDTDFVSTPNVNPCSEHGLQVQTVENKLGQGGDGDTDSISTSTLNLSPDPELLVKTVEKKPGPGGDGDTELSLASTLTLTPEPEDKVQTEEEKPGTGDDTDTGFMSTLALNPSHDWWSWFLGYLRYFSQKIFNTLWG